MSFQTEALPFSLLDHSLDPRQKTLFRAWRENNLRAAMMEHFEHLALLTVDRNTQLPVDLYKGEKSLAAKVLGKSWQKDFTNSAGSEKILEAYEMARFGEPTYEYVCHDGNRDGRKFNVTYERLVLPLRVGGGLPQFVTLSTQVAFEIQPIVLRNLDSDHVPSHIANSQILLGTEERANLAHRAPG